MSLHEDLQRFREYRGLSQYQLASLAGVSQSTISHVESGRRLPSMQVLLALLEALDAELTLQLKEDIHKHHPDRLDGGAA